MEDYDWANSAFSTTVVATLLSPYLTRLAQEAVGKNGTVLNLGILGSVNLSRFRRCALSISVGAHVLFLPILGSLVIYSNLKKRLMAISATWE